MLTEIFAIIVAYVGILLGFSLSKIAKSEVKAGEKNLKRLEWCIRLIIWFIFILTLNTATIGMILVLIVLIVIELIFKNNNYIFGMMLGMNPTFLMSSLIFLYGLPAGSLLHKQKLADVVKKTSLFLLFAVFGLLSRSLL